jgi:hypothetical protein
VGDEPRHYLYALLCAGLILLIISLFSVSRCENVAMRVAERTSFFAILGLRVGFARIANVLGLVWWLATILILSFLCFMACVATLLVAFAISPRSVAIKLVQYICFTSEVANCSRQFAT